MPTRLTLLTDFGTADGYVGAMKGVIASHAADAIVDDIAHDIPPGDIDAAAWALGAYWRRYPEGSAHVVVVDPGVGTARRALAAEADGRFLVGPDNGVLSWALRDAWRAGDVRALDPPASAELSATFHGRDLFAPAAARLAAGQPIASLGPPALGIVRLSWPEPVRTRGGVEGVVVHVDRYGNLVTNVPGVSVTGETSVRIGDAAIATGSTYGDVASGEAIAYVGSRGLLEIAVRDGRAADRLGGKGHVVRLRTPH
jgi:S-adenosylmethionine hydrolase